MIKDINFDLVGNLVAKLREKYGLNQQEFAKEIGVSKGAVCQWEQGSGIKTENLYDIANFFNITISELIDGQLDEEEDEDYFERNYNLDDFGYFSEINDSNYGDLLEYLKRCKNVIKRFMALYALREQNKLTKKQNSEYHKMLRYFEPDYEYAEAIQIGMHVNSIDETIEELTESFGINDKSELDYMLYKIFSLNVKINAFALLSYEKGDTAVNEYLEIKGKEHSDTLLTFLTNGIEEEKIENSLAIKRLIEAGARCFFTREHISSFEYNEIDEDVFKQLSGVFPNTVIQDRYNFFESEKKTNRILERFDPYSWKNYDRDGYEYLIDFDTTNRIRDLVLLKESDPKTYYKNLVERDAKCL